MLVKAVWPTNNERNYRIYLFHIFLFGKNYQHGHSGLCHPAPAVFGSDGFVVTYLVQATVHTVPCNALGRLGQGFTYPSYVFKPIQAEHNFRIGRELVKDPMAHGLSADGSLGRD